MYTCICILQLLYLNNLYSYSSVCVSAHAHTLSEHVILLTSDQLLFNKTENSQACCGLLLCIGTGTVYYNFQCGFHKTHEVLLIFS